MRFSMDLPVRALVSIAACLSVAGCVVRYFRVLSTS